MGKTRLGFVCGAAALALLCQVPAFAQVTTADELMAMSVSSLRGEIEQRYGAALAMSQDATVVSVDSNQYMWASQAKVQCGIAIGFLKSRTKDPVSIGKCNDAYVRMQAPPPPPQLPPPPRMCDQQIAGLIFFEWDSAVPPADAMQTLNSVASNLQGCAWAGLSVTGHADRSGTDAYNQRLSQERAFAVSNMLQSMGVGTDQLDISARGESDNRVQTEDGVREPQNRRVEIIVDTGMEQGQ